MIEREIGILGVSIGTCPPLLSLEPENLLSTREKAYSQQVVMVMFNITTLIRNYFASMNKENYDNLNLTEAFDELLSEIGVIRQYVEGIGKKLIWYYQDSKQLKWLFPNAEYREVKTDRQILEVERTDALVNALYRELSGSDAARTLSKDTKQYSSEYGTFHEIGVAPVRSLDVAAIITHEPHQLFWQRYYPRLYLFESHTGAVKSTSDFHTKLKTLKNDVELPFNQITLTMFGDGVHFKPSSISVRREMVEIATADKWTLLTSPNGMVRTVARLGSDILKDAYGKLCTYYT